VTRHTSFKSRKKNSIIEKYDSSSEIYNKRYRDIQRKKFELGFRYISFFSGVFLDAGCGTGLILDHLEKVLEHDDESRIHYVGIDISRNMLLKFRLREKKSSSSIKTNIILADIENIPVRDNIGNAIISFTSIQNVPDFEACFQELIRIGRDQAPFILTILNKTINLQDLEKNLLTFLSDLKIEVRENIEDAIFTGKLVKN